MIHVSNNQFLLSGKNFSYAMFVNGQGYLQKLHFGAPITPADFSFLVQHVGTIQQPPADNPNRDNYLDGMPSECPFFGRVDTCEPMLLLQGTDGAVVSRFTYLSHTVTNGAPQLPGLPCARSGGQTLSVTLADTFSSAQVTLNYTVWDDHDVIVKNCQISAPTKPLTIKRAYSFACDFTDARFNVLRLWGDWGKERSPETAPLAHGSIKLQSLRGTSSHQLNPFLGLLRPDCTETVGECYGFQLVYSGSFALSAELGNKGQTRILGGINDLGFAWQLAAGETFHTPQAIIAYSNQGLGQLSRSYADFIRAHIVHPKWATARRPIVVNNWEATYFNFNNQRLFPLIDQAAALGIDTFVLDDGWFGKREAANSGLGDWFVNTQKLEGGLTPIIERCKQHGLKFGLWFEPEMVSEDSNLYRTHPQWIIAHPAYPSSQQRNQLVLDFTRPEVVQHVFNAMSQILQNNQISYVKWDMNRSLSEFYSAALPADRQGELAHRYVLGVYQLAHQLTTAFPNVFFEGCASGGGRFDAGMLYYFPQIWTSDDTDGYERTKIQWGTSICYPQSAISCHVSACPNHQTERTTPLQTRGAVASLGPTGYELDLTALTEEEKSTVARQIAEYKQIDDLVLNGDLYRLQSPFDGVFFCQMLVSKDKSRAYLVGQRLLSLPRDVNRIIYLHGLDDASTYTIAELGITATGSALKNCGVVAPKLADFGSWTWHLTKVK